MAKKQKKILPCVRVKVQISLNCDAMGGYVFEVREVEVLTVHFNTGMMRVRYTCDDYFGQGPKVRTAEVSNAPFIKKCMS